jgi:hypothetical protein
MTALFVPLLREGDHAVVDVALPDLYQEYLRKYGLAGGEACAAPNGTGTPFVWGWDRSVMQRMAPVEPDTCPPLEVVRKVNGRAFAAAVAKRCGLGVPGSRFCRSVQEVDAVLSGSDAVFPLVIKPAFGGSGYGFRTLHSIDQWTAERPRTERLCSSGGVVVEPWLVRKYDMSTSTVIGRDGAIGPVAFQRQWVNGFGAYYGSYCDDGDPVVCRWKERLEAATRSAAAEVAKEGYFGPAGFDSFIYERRNKSEHLAAVIEINARYTMGMLAQELRRRLSLNQPVAMRSIGRKKCRLPESVEGWNARCGGLAFDIHRKNGILLLSPLRAGFEGIREQPQRSVFLITGGSEEEVMYLDRELRSLLQPD